MATRTEYILPARQPRYRTLAIRTRNTRHTRYIPTVFDIATKRRSRNNLFQSFSTDNTLLSPEDRLSWLPSDNGYISRRVSPGARTRKSLARLYSSSPFPHPATHRDKNAASPARQRIAMRSKVLSRRRQNPEKRCSRNSSLRVPPVLSLAEATIPTARISFDLYVVSESAFFASRHIVFDARDAPATDCPSLR